MKYTPTKIKSPTVIAFHSPTLKNHGFHPQVKLSPVDSQLKQLLSSITPPISLSTSNTLNPPISSLELLFVVVGFVDALLLGTEEDVAGSVADAGGRRCVAIISSIGFSEDEEVGIDSYAGGGYEARVSVGRGGEIGIVSFPYP
jgi:hypothetical protein